MRLTGQVALVTGGGTGIGRGISLAFAREEGRVAVNYSKFEEGRRAVSTPDLPTPEDLAEAALFLAADAKATTGTTIFVDGGIIPLGPRGYRPAARTRK